MINLHILKNHCIPRVIPDWWQCMNLLLHCWYLSYLWVFCWGCLCMWWSMMHVLSHLYESDSLKSKEHLEWTQTLSRVSFVYHLYLESAHPGHICSFPGWDESLAETPSLPRPRVCLQEAGPWSRGARYLPVLEAGPPPGSPSGVSFFPWRLPGPDAPVSVDRWLGESKHNIRTSKAPSLTWLSPEVWWPTTRQIQGGY